MAKRGRKSAFTPKLALRICESIASGKSLRKICEEKGIPAKSNILKWLVDGKHREFQDQYAQARAAQAYGWADEIVDIADDGTNDTYTIVRGDGDEAKEEERVNYDNIHRSKLRVEARKWLMMKELPKKFGDKVTEEGSGASKPPDCRLQRGPEPERLRDLKQEPKEPKTGTGN